MCIGKTGENYEASDAATRGAQGKCTRKGGGCCPTFLMHCRRKCGQGRPRTGRRKGIESRGHTPGCLPGVPEEWGRLPSPSWRPRPRTGRRGKVRQGKAEQEDFRSVGNVGDLWATSVQDTRTHAHKEPGHWWCRGVGVHPSAFLGWRLVKGPLSWTCALFCFSRYGCQSMTKLLLIIKST